MPNDGFPTHVEASYIAAWSSLAEGMRLLVAVGAQPNGLLKPESQVQLAILTRELRQTVFKVSKILHTELGIEIIRDPSELGQVTLKDNPDLGASPLKDNPDLGASPLKDNPDLGAPTLKDNPDLGAPTLKDNPELSSPDFLSGEEA